MKRFLLYVFVIIAMHAQSNAQLLPTIGLNSLPSDTAPICTIPWYLGSFYTSGLPEGGYAHDFKLYSINGDSLVLSAALATGKPVLLISGSLTCPVFMGKIPVINQVISTYGSQLQVYVIYTVEAHPTDTSVYFGYVNVTNSNINAGILFPQPLTYGERKHLVDTMSQWATLNAPVFVDGPCNEWWSTFGPAPNNAYLIDTTGRIFSKHGWFHKNTDNIFCDIDSLLGVSSGLCNSSGNGTFQLQILNSSVSGSPGNILYTFANLINNSNTDARILIKKLEKNLPSGWQTAFCADLCYSPTDDSIVVTVAANDTLLFSLDFITSAMPDSGSVRVGFRNTDNYANAFQAILKANTLATHIDQVKSPSYPRIYPNPADDIVKIDLSGNLNLDLRIYDSLGNVVMQRATVYPSDGIDVSHLPAGHYIIVMTDGKHCTVSKFIRKGDL